MALVSILFCLQARGIREVFSIGRVQSPTVYLIYQRQKEIEAFVSEPFYEIEATFTAKNGTYKGKAKAKDSKREIIRDLLAKHNIHPKSPGVVTSVETIDKLYSASAVTRTVYTTGNGKPLVENESRECVEDDARAL